MPIADALKVSTSATADDEFRLGRIVRRTWPYIRPQIGHVTIWIVLTLFIEAIFFAIALPASDIFNNKVVQGEFLEPLQAEFLFLDDSYARPTGSGGLTESEAQATQPADDEAEVDPALAEPDLTDAQRRTVRDRLFIVFGIVGLIVFSLSPTVEAYKTWILQRINQNLRVTMIERAEHLSLRYHVQARAGDAIYRVYQDSAMITKVIQQAILEPVNGLFQAGFAFVVLLLFSLTLGVLFVVAIVPVFWFVRWYTPRLRYRSRIARMRSSDLTSRVQEVFAATRLIKANQAEALIDQTFSTDATAAIDAAFWLRVEFNVVRIGVMFLSSLALFASFYLMADWTVAGDPTFAVGAFAIVGFVAWNLGAFQNATGRSEEFVDNGRWLVYLWAVLQDIGAGLNRAFFLLDLKPEIVDRDEAADFPSTVSEVSFEDVRFRYDPDIGLLEQVSLKAHAGTVTAIVGATGSGKSTLASLLLRLYDVDAGKIAINGIDIRDLKVDELRRRVAIALQQNVLFAASVKDNIAYASDATLEQVEAAGRVALVDRFVDELEHGYDTELGERGGKLSTGQRQRLSIARAVVRDTPILILDEPTASLDAETEHAVLANLGTWASDRVVFLITHRLSTIKNADQIAFLKDGVITEVGRHDELVANDGDYKRFIDAETGGVNE